MLGNMLNAKSTVNNPRYGFRPLSNRLSFIPADAAGGPTVMVLGSTLGGVFIGLLLLLLIFVLYMRQRRNTGFEPLIKADFSNRKYTEEA